MTVIRFNVETIRAPRLRIVQKPDHTIRIAPETFGCGFDVTVEPVPIGVGHDRELATYADAKAYADRLSAAMGWPILDQCEGEK